MRLAALVWLAFWLASCRSLPQSDEPSWLDDDALRACLGEKIPTEMLDAPGVRAGSVALEVVVLPSGRIQHAAVLASSGNAALDEYLAQRFRDARCMPFAPTESEEAYSVEIEIDIRTKR